MEGLTQMAGPHPGSNPELLDAGPAAAEPGREPALIPAYRGWE